MARGKQAVAAARGRYESAVEHIDRLTTELADAKIRARLVEKQAARVPDLERRVAELTAQVGADTPKQLRIEIEAHERTRAAAEALRLDAADSLRKFGVLRDWILANVTFDNAKARNRLKIEALLDVMEGREPGSTRVVWPDGPPDPDMRMRLLREPRKAS